MREDCRHFESRTYNDSGEVVRYCTLDLAPEAPWRCPADCPRYERSLIDGTFERGSLDRHDPEPEPEGQGIAELLDEAEDIVNEAQAGALGDLDQPVDRRRWWQRWRRKGDDGPFRLSQR
jgi:hypothetical protein